MPLTTNNMNMHNALAASPVSMSPIKVNCRLPIYVDTQLLDLVSRRNR